MSAIDYEMRRSFVYQDGNLRFCPKRNTSNQDWLIKGEGMSEEEFKNTVHGALYPGRAYFYKGWDNTTTDEEVERVAQACRGLFNNQTEICCGAIPGEPGTIWEPIKILGYGSSQAGTVD